MLGFHGDFCRDRCYLNIKSGYKAGLVIEIE